MAAQVNPLPALNALAVLAPLISQPDITPAEAKRRGENILSVYRVGYSGASQWALQEALRQRPESVYPTLKLFLALAYGIPHWLVDSVVDVEIRQLTILPRQPAPDNWEKTHPDLPYVYMDSVDQQLRTSKGQKVAMIHLPKHGFDGFCRNFHEAKEQDRACVSGALYGVQEICQSLEEKCKQLHEKAGPFCVGSRCLRFNNWGGCQYNCCGHAPKLHLRSMRTDSVSKEECCVKRRRHGKGHFDEVELDPDLIISPSGVHKLETCARRWYRSVAGLYLHYDFKGCKKCMTLRLQLHKIEQLE